MVNFWITKLQKAVKRYGSKLYNALQDAGFADAETFFHGIPEFKEMLGASDAPSAFIPSNRYEEMIADDPESYSRERYVSKELSGIFHSIKAMHLRFKDIDKEISDVLLRYLLTAYVVGDTHTELDPIADEMAADLEMEDVLQLIWRNMLDHPELMRLYARHASDDQIAELIRMRSKWHSWYDYGQKGRTAESSVFDAVMYSETRSAMLFAEKLGCLDEYAKLRGTDADTIRDGRMLNFGLDNDGKKLYDIGGTTIAATLGNDLKIALYDEKAGKVVKSIPKRGNDADLIAAASADLSELKKNIKKAVKIRNDQLFHTFLSGSERDAAGWKTSYLGNAVLKCVARLIVWAQGDATFILRSNDIVDSAGNAYALTDGPIRVAHPMEMTPEDIAAWQEYFCQNGLKQLFEQIWEPAYKQEDISEDRYNGIHIDVYEMMNKEKHGIYFEDENFHECLDFSFGYAAGCQLESSCYHGRHSLDGYFELGKLTITNMNRETNHIIYILDKMTIKKRLIEDDAAIVELLDGYTAAQITEFIAIANENNCVNCLAALMDYKDTHFAFAADFDEFILD